MTDRLRLAAQEALYAHDNPSMVPDKSRVWDALRRALAEPAPCEKCEGTGSYPPGMTHEAFCPRCGGTGAQPAATGEGK